MLIVEDDGFGIEVDVCECVFEFFVRFDFSRDWVIGGCGFGFVIVYFIVLVMGGSVVCDESELGGVKFSFYWLVWYVMFNVIVV